ncbi:MAG TPA: hypothetical protein VHT51_14620 [Micropepsaceae bacterium]|nr:hypothetical protein [Micropepsaceae bacterium]
MKFSQMALLIVVSSGLCGSAMANFFHNPNTNTNLNVGSAPSPTPEDLQAAEGRLASRSDFDLTELLGKPVYGKDRSYLGSVSDVDPDRNLAAVRIASNQAVAVSGRALINDGPRVLAPSLTASDIASMPRIPESELAR